MAAPRTISSIAVVALIAMGACSNDHRSAGTTTTTTSPGVVSFSSSGSERDGWFWLERAGTTGRWEVSDLPAGAGAISLDVRAVVGTDTVTAGAAPVALRWGQGDQVRGTKTAVLPATPSAHQPDFALANGSLIATGVDLATSDSLWVEITAPSQGTLGVRAESVRVAAAPAAKAGVSAPATTPTPQQVRLDGEFTSNGNLISGWYWVRDAAHAQYARWRFPEVPNLASGVTLQFHVLATDRPSGGPGVDARFYLTYGWVTTLEASGTAPADAWSKTILTTVRNVSPLSDPLGYTAQDTLDLTFSDVPAEAVGLWFEIGRADPEGAGAPTTEHVAFNAASLGVLATAAGSNDDSGTGDGGSGGGTITGDLLVDPDGLSDSDTMADADVVGDLPSGSYHGTLGDDDTDDWFAFRLNATQIVDLTVAGQGGLRVSPELWDPMHNNRAPRDQQVGEPSFSFSADRGNGGRWFLHVARSAGSGTYTFSIVVRDPNDGLRGVDAGDDRATALVVGGGDLLGEVDRADLGDFYSIQLAAGQSLTANLQSLNTENYELELYQANGTSIDADVAYPGEAAALLAPAGAARTVIVSVIRSGGFGGVYVLRLALSGVGECDGDLSPAASYKAFGDVGTELTGLTADWRWLAANDEAARYQFATWTFDALPDDSTVRLMVDLPLVPVGGAAPAAESVYAVWGVTPGGTTSSAPQLVTLQVQSRAGSITGFAAVGEIDIPHASLSATDAGAWWVRLSLTAQGQAQISTVSPYGVGTATGSVQLCAGGNVEQLDGVTGPAEPPDVNVTYDGATKTLSSDASMFVDPTTDVDGDGLNQKWEDAAIPLANPVIEVDEEEMWLHYFDEVPTVNLVEATLWPSAANPQYVVIGYLNTWGYDPGGGVEFFQVKLSENHRGDSERIWTAWRIVDDQHVRLEWVNTSAHMSMTDHSAVWNANDRTCNLGYVASVDLPSTTPHWGFQQVLCSALEFDGAGRLVIYTSENKHAMYPTSSVCEDVIIAADSTFNGPVWGEDCGWETINDPFGIWWDDDDFNGDSQYVSDGRWRFHTYNVGEPGYPLIDSLGTAAGLPFSYANEAVWSGRNNSGSNFCGGFQQNDVIEMPWYRANLVMPERCSTLLASKYAGWQPVLLDALASRYRLELVTGTDLGAGTDEAVFIELNGANGALLGATGVRGYWGDLEAGHTDIVYVDPVGSPTGPVTSVNIRRSATDVSLGADWQLSSVKVTDMVTGQSTTFQVNQWVHSGTGISVS